MTTKGKYEQVSDELRGRPRRWLVTGAAGFIGSALLERLLALDQHIVGVDNFLTGHRANLDDAVGSVDRAKERFTFLEGDLREPAIAARACHGIDVVLHQAALGSVPRSMKDPVASHQHNVDAFLNVLVAARDAGVRRVVYASSAAVYGDHPGLPKREGHIGAPISPYALTKRIDEEYAQLFQRVYGVESIGLRYFNVFGRRQDIRGAYTPVIPRWISAMLARQPCVIYGDGSNSRDFCYVDNIVQANILAATADASTTNTVYNCGCNGQTNLATLFELVRDNLARIFPKVAGTKPVHEPPRSGDTIHSLAAIDRIAAALGYAPTHQVPEGMSETVSWYARRLGSQV